MRGTGTAAAGRSGIERREAPDRLKKYEIFRGFLAWLDFVFMLIYLVIVPHSCAKEDLFDTRVRQLATSQRFVNLHQ